LKLKFISIRKAKADEEKVKTDVIWRFNRAPDYIKNTHIGSKIGFL